MLEISSVSSKLMAKFYSVKSSKVILTMLFLMINEGNVH